MVYNFPSGFIFTPPLTNSTLIDWDDTTKPNIILPHTYTSSGIYTVKIYGSEITSLNHTENTSAPYLLRCTTFANVGLTDLSGAFAGCSQLLQIPTILPTTVTVLTNLFTTSYSGTEFMNWNISNITDMTNMLQGPLSISNYNTLLNTWSNSTILPNVTFSSNNLIYSSDGEIWRNSLTDPSSNNWTILGDVILSSSIYQNINFTLTYNNIFTVDTTYDLYISSTKVGSIVYNSTDTFITYTVNTTLSGTRIFTIVSNNVILFTSYLTIIVQNNCIPTIKPQYTFSEQVSSSDRIKQLKQQTNCNITI